MWVGSNVTLVSLFSFLVLLYAVAVSYMCMLCALVELEICCLAVIIKKSVRKEVLLVLSTTDVSVECC